MSDQSPEPFPEEFPETLHIKFPEPFTNQQKDDISLPENISNNQASNKELQESLTNNPDDKGKDIDNKKEKPRSSVKMSLTFFAVLIFFIELFLNFNFIMSDIFANGLYGPDEKVNGHLVKMFIFGIPSLFLICALLPLSQKNNNTKKSLTIFFMLFIIKILLFIGYFIFLLLDREKKEIRLLTLIPEIAFDVIIVINKKLSINQNR